MGMCLDSTSKMGEYSVEVRSESFYLRGADSYNERQRHAFDLYVSNQENGQGTVEILIEDIPKIRAALDAVESYIRSKT